MTATDPSTSASATVQIGNRIISRELHELARDVDVHEHQAMRNGDGEPLRTCGRCGDDLAAARHLRVGENAYDARVRVLEAFSDSLRAENAELQKELVALQAGARTGLLKFMMAGDVGRFVDRVRQELQALLGSGHRGVVQAVRRLDAIVSALFADAQEKTAKGTAENERLRTENVKLALELAQLQNKPMRDKEREAKNADDSIRNLRVDAK